MVTPSVDWAVVAAIITGIATIVAKWLVPALQMLRTNGNGRATAEAVELRAILNKLSETQSTIAEVLKDITKSLEDHRHVMEEAPRPRLNRR